MTEEKKERRPQCEGKVTANDGSKHRCILDGYHCWVLGSFGRHHQILCGKCIDRARKIGWTVSYMIEGDNPTKQKEA